MNNKILYRLTVNLSEKGFTVTKTPWDIATPEDQKLILKLTRADDKLRYVKQSELFPASTFKAERSDESITYKAWCYYNQLEEAEDILKIKITKDVIYMKNTIEKLFVFL